MKHKKAFRWAVTLAMAVAAMCAMSVCAGAAWQKCNAAAFEAEYKKDENAGAVYTVQYEGVPDPVTLDEGETIDSSGQYRVVLTFTVDSNTIDLFAGDANIVKGDTVSGGFSTMVRALDFAHKYTGAQGGDLEETQMTVTLLSNVRFDTASDPVMIATNTTVDLNGNTLDARGATSYTRFGKMKDKKAPDGAVILPSTAAVGIGDRTLEKDEVFDLPVYDATVKEVMADGSLGDVVGGYHLYPITYKYAVTDDSSETEAKIYFQLLPSTELNLEEQKRMFDCFATPKNSDQMTIYFEVNNEGSPTAKQRVALRDEDLQQWAQEILTEVDSDEDYTSAASSRGFYVRLYNFKQDFIAEIRSYIGFLETLPASNNHLYADSYATYTHTMAS